MNICHFTLHLRLSKEQILANINNQCCTKLREFSDWFDYLQNYCRDFNEIWFGHGLIY